MYPMRPHVEKWLNENPKVRESYNALEGVMPDLQIGFVSEEPGWYGELSEEINPFTILVRSSMLAGQASHIIYPTGAVLYTCPRERCVYGLIDDQPCLDCRQWGRFGPDTDIRR